MTGIASAPGKIVLSGEYAVLSGAPAICMAIDRRAVAMLRPARGGGCRVHAIGVAGANRFRIVDAVCADARPDGDIVLDTSEFAEDGTKIGVGSSAALTVALTAALSGSDDVMERALAAHTRLQGRAGSGVDVATAFHGGLVRYAMSPRKVDRIAWPAGLAFRVIWTGAPASTTAKLAKLLGKRPRKSRIGFEDVAASMADHWSCGEADALLDGYRRYIEALRRFSVDHDLGVFDAGHDALTEAAMADGLIYKPAGAGGGDIGTLFGRNEDELDAFIDRHSALVHRIVPCALDPQGVRLERS